MKPRILIVDDHPMVREGLAVLLRGPWDICGEAGNGREAIARVVELKPDLVLLDLRMPIMGGTEAAKEIRRPSPSTKIIFLSMHDSETVFKLARFAGADACVSKHAPAADLRTAITAVLRPAHPSR